MKSTFFILALMSVIVLPIGTCSRYKAIETTNPYSLITNEFKDSISAIRAEVMYLKYDRISKQRSIESFLTSQK